MKKGDRVERDKMWKHKDLKGTVIKVTKDYTVIKWDGVNGEWHYTEDQAKSIRVIQS